MDVSLNGNPRRKHTLGEPHEVRPSIREVAQ
jgi:hypothetical protein